MYISLDVLNKNEAKFALSPDQILSRKAEINSKRAVELDGKQRFQQRKSMLKAVPDGDAELAYERYIGANDLVPVNYLQIGTLKSRAVGRLRYFDRRVGRQAMATGFLISPNLLLTNHHVFSAPDSFKDGLIDFDYAYGSGGRELEKITFELDPARFFYANKELDCALVAIAQKDVTGRNNISERGYLILNPAPGKAGLGDCATIIQHPDGDYQQIALRGNKILEITNSALLYVSDTSPGSSGSPVFNDEWQVIALHSAGVAKKKNGVYVDSDDQPIPEIDGHVEASRIVWLSNTGTRVSSLVADWMAQPSISSHPFLRFLQQPDYVDEKARNTEQSVAICADSQLDNDQQTTPMKNTGSDSASAITININLNLAGRPSADVTVNGNGERSLAQPRTSSAGIIGLKSSDGLTDEALEAKIDEEKNKDYSRCTGFDERFMADRTPLPTLNPQLMRKVATLSGNARQFVLNYDHYSTVVHSIRRMPIVSAINVEGDPVVRRDTSKRADVWMRDNRIDFAVQLSDAFYDGSNFDKGHMSRREDADWGASASKAEAAADLTCMYTNACPQVPNLNRAVFGYHGFWGQLEKIVLEKGVRKEKGDTSKICVFNGPIFRDADPTFRGVQIPMSFYKIIVWRNTGGEMKATAFVLSQADLVSGIAFEELQFDKEFVEHQCSIAYIENLTNLKFTGIDQWDTSPKKGDVTAVNGIDRVGVEGHIAKHSSKGSGSKPAQPKDSRSRTAPTGGR